MDTCQSVFWGSSGQCWSLSWACKIPYPSEGGPGPWVPWRPRDADIGCCVAASVSNSHLSFHSSVSICYCSSFLFNYGFLAPFPEFWVPISKKRQISELKADFLYISIGSSGSTGHFDSALWRSAVSLTLLFQRLSNMTFNNFVTVLERIASNFSDQVIFWRSLYIHKHHCTYDWAEMRPAVHRPL